MIGEGVIALIWCAIALSYFDNLEGLSAAITNGGPGNVVYASSFGLLGVVGGVLAFLGVVILPITSGDTAFRSTVTCSKMLKSAQLITKPYQAFYRNTEFARKSTAYPL